MGANPMQAVADRICEVGRKFTGDANRIVEEIERHLGSTDQTRAAIKIQDRRSQRMLQKLHAEMRRSRQTQDFIAEIFVDLRGDLLKLGAATQAVEAQAAATADLRGVLDRLATSLERQADQQG